MSNAQSEALRRAAEILGEHFDSYALSVSASDADGEHVERLWEGGAIAALGHATRLAGWIQRYMDSEDTEDEIE